MPEQSALEVASAPELGATSESEEMYLITVARAAEEGRPVPVPVAAIAGELHVSVASANQMVRKLSDRGLLTYEPYHGVRLSPEGRRVADRVLRTRRLWATFLVEHLGFSPGEADDQACHLEHVTLAATADRLADLLGNPEAGPLGRPIPSGSASSDLDGRRRLDEVAAGDVVEIVAVNVDDAVLRFLSAEGVAPGSRVYVAAVGARGLLLEIGDARVHLAADLLSQVEVKYGNSR